MNSSVSPDESAERINLSHAEHGEGEPVILVHGSNSDQRIWDQHLKIIGFRYRAIAVCLRYFGGKPWPDTEENFRVSVLADDLAYFVRGLGVGPVTIIGWSLGGAVSLTMALRNRKFVRRMFLYEPSLTTFVTDADDARAAAEDRLAMMSAAKPLAASGYLAGAVRLFMDGVNAEGGAFDRLAPEVQTMMTENARMLPLLFAGPPAPQVSADDLRAFDRPVTIAGLRSCEARSIFGPFRTPGVSASWFFGPSIATDGHPCDRALSLAVPAKPAQHFRPMLAEKYH
jgi:pimeloyl-ACP methyl ester carboxylesterase